jgi:signal transduction histidine kinase
VLIASLVQFLAWLAGRAVANQRSYSKVTAEYHEHRLQEHAARARAAVAQAEHAVVRERLRIAQELHDVVAHSMSVIAVQAGVGHHIAAEQPEKAAAALAAIEGASRDALQEMRRLLGVLRGPEELAPAPGLADLPALAQATARAGIEVDLRLEGARRCLPAGVELAAYRIVQEALTNVVKHADTDRSQVVVSYQPRQLSIEVTDRGRGPAAARAAGRGLVGMRERVAAYGGQLTAEALPQRGFRVSAVLPLEPER